MTEDPAAPVIRIAHASEMPSGHILDLVVRREALVDEGIVRGEEVEEAPVLTNEVIEEHLGLLPHRIGEILIEVRIEVGIRTDLIQVLQAKPLGGKPAAGGPD